jgi:hypothetical protein
MNTLTFPLTNYSKKSCTNLYVVVIRNLIAFRNYCFFCGFLLILYFCPHKKNYSIAQLNFIFKWMPKIQKMVENFFPKKILLIFFSILRNLWFYHNNHLVTIFFYNLILTGDNLSNCICTVPLTRIAKSGWWQFIGLPLLSSRGWCTQGTKIPDWRVNL